ncbi:hypothetical protein IWW39_003820 [Coemansia spiralis]|uniref:Ankyrin n=1 Tax=Coemansia spiralis TaxID=417178 RepID=A0A9W8GE63_9FUNG|nr:hypothetical protein IWW39_003820 [Coemansia spiralis]
MDRDSEVETVLADDDWYGTSGEGLAAAVAGRGTRRRNRREERGPRLLPPHSNNEGGDAFDEEELFSPSGSLSSLHEFSDNEDALSDNSDAARGSGGPIVRNGLSSSARSRLSDACVDTGSPVESEVDVDGEDMKGVARVKTVRKTSSLRDSSPSSAWQVPRGRKVIADEDDEDEGGLVGSVAAEDADIEDGPDSKVRRKKQRLEHGARRLPSVGEAESKQADAGAADPSFRKHKQSKRRKPRYEEPDSLDDEGCPQLVYFAAKGDTATCRKLLLRGATVSKADAHGWTALHEASKHSHVETLELLLNPPARARLHADTDHGSDCGAGSDITESRTVRQLLSPLPNVNAATQHSRLTPLHQAVANEDLIVVRLLLDHGARTCVINSRQLTPLDTCSNEKIARILTDRAKLQRSISARDKAGQTKLHRACNAGDLELTVSLINQGADVNLKDNAGWTPLHEAALEGHNTVVVALLRRGADFAARGFGGDTPLHDACANGHVDVARSLLVVGADPLARNLKHVTPEDMAKEEEQDEVLQLIDAHRRGLLRAPPRTAHVDSGTSAKLEKNGKGKRPASVPVAGAVSVRGADSGSSERLPKSRPRPTQPSPARSKDGQGERRPASALSNDSDDQGAGSTSAQKRELVSLRRLREEAEKPLVNYYFSSSSSKMTRDERKLQVLMGTIERMEKRKPKEKERRQASAEPEAGFVSDKAATTVETTVEDSGVRAVANGEDDDSGRTEGSRHRHHLDSGPSSSLSPKRRRGRPPKKRVIDDDDDDKELAPVALVLDAPAPARHTNKRARRDTNATADSAPTVITIDGTSTPRHVPISPTLDEPVKAAMPTVEIKTEPKFIASPTPVSKHASRHGLPGTTAVHRDKPSKHQRVAEGGRTIVEGAVPQRAEAMTPSSIAAQAIRYLPLYTIQLHDDAQAPKPSYFVVDLQVRLLLGMPVDTTSSTSGGSKSDANPLFAAYPHLCRRRISDAQKERLWEPLAGMFVSNMQFIHDSTTATPSNADSEAATPPPAMLPRKSAERKPRSATGSSRSSVTATSAKADSELVSQFTLHEKKKFVGLGLYFVKLDEVVEIIRRDFPQISKQLITITLDLSTVDIAAAVAPPGLRPLSDVIDGDEPAPRCPEWTGPQHMLPLRYALKLHYRDRLAFIKGAGGTEGKP